MTRFHPVRFLGVLVGTVVILTVGLYGPATLLGPLPSAKATLVTPPAKAANPSPPVLPTGGASAVMELTPADTETAEPAEPTAPLAVAGTADPLPLAAIAKVVTALVVLDAKPVEVGAAGPSATLTTDDYQGYLDYTRSGARTVTVFQGETWTEREMLQAMLLGSSNNHADTLARWAFGSVDAYVEAANAWLTAKGLTGTRVADATGLHDSSAGTATDLARLAGLASTQPVVSEIIANPAGALAGRRGVDNTTAYLPELGVTGISRSYTDAAGVCFLFTAQITGAGKDEKFTFSGAFIGEPDYDTLGADVTALMKSASAGVAQLPLLAEGDAYARFTTPWGATASGVVGRSKTRFGWQAAPPSAPTVTLERFSTGRAGTVVGLVSVGDDGGRVASALELDRAIPDPGAGWRLLHPIPLITALFDSRG